MNSLETHKQHFLAHLVGVRGRAQSTSQAYEYDLAHFFNYLNQLGISDVPRIATQHIEGYLQQQTTSMVTKARRRSSIATFLNYLTKQQVITDNPCQRLESIKLSQKEPAFLTLEQQAQLMQAVRRTTPYYRKRDIALISLLIMSGLRRAEVVSLDIRDVDLASCRLRVVRKGGREQRLPIHPDLATELEGYIGSLERANNQPLFISRLGNRLSAQALWHLVKGYAKQAGLDAHVTTHSLRHGFASTLLAQDVPLSYIQSLLGHKNIHTTSRYLHFQNSQLREAFGRVGF